MPVRDWVADAPVAGVAPLLPKVLDLEAAVWDVDGDFAVFGVAAGVVVGRAAGWFAGCVVGRGVVLTFFEVLIFTFTLFTLYDGALMLVGAR